MSSLKKQIEAARARHDMRCLSLRDERWQADRRGLIEGSCRLMEREIAEIRQRAANDNLSRCAGSVTTYNPLTGKTENDND
jgi:hypothetical protein